MSTSVAVEQLQKSIEALDSEIESCLERFNNDCDPLDLDESVDALQMIDKQVSDLLCKIEVSGTHEQRHEVVNIAFAWMLCSSFERANVVHI